MQREIKFRGMAINGGWHYGLLSISQGKKGQPPAGYYISNEAGMPWAFQVRPETLGQFTGEFCDKERDLYEGDIVETGYGKGQILFDAGCFWIQWIDDPEANMEPLGFMIKTFHRRELVKLLGNVHDNPELLVTH